MKVFVGIDPGKYGCAAFYCVPEYETEKSELHFIDFHFTGDELKTFSKLNRNQSIMRKIWAQIQMNIDVLGVPELLVIEAVGPSPKDGKAGAFTFGKNAGTVEGMFIALGTKMICTSPGVWKGLMNLNPQKARSIALAKKLFAETTISLEGAFDKPKHMADGRAEAALLAWLGANKTGAITR